MVAPREMAAFMVPKACSSGVGMGRHVMPRRPKPVMGRGLGSGIVYVWGKECGVRERGVCVNWGRKGVMC